jgi:hypothetical protein
MPLKFCVRFRARFFLPVSLALSFVPAFGLPDPSWSGPRVWFPAASDDLHLPELDTMARKLGMKKESPGLFFDKNKTLYYSGKTSILGTMPLNFMFYGAVPNPTREFPVTPSNDSIAYYAFQGSNPALQNFFRSAYLQEIDAAYAPPSGYRDYAPKSARTFHRRMWLSQGYAWQYLAQDEPLMGGANLMLTAYGYVWDALSAALITALAVNIAREPDAGSIGGAALGVGLVAGYRLLTIPIGNGQIRDRNRIARSGYRVPEFDPGRRAPGDTTLW